MDGMLFPKVEAAWLLAASLVIRDMVVRGSILLAGLLVVGLLIGRVRRWRTQESDTSGEPWTLQDLRDLHASGELTDEEFERLKAAMLAAYESSSSESGPEESGSDDATG